MSLIAAAVDPATIKDEYAGLIDELAALDTKTAQLNPIPAASWSVTIRKIRNAARTGQHGIRVWSKTDVPATDTEPAQVVAVIGLVAPVERAKSGTPRQPRKPSKTDGPGNVVGETDGTASAV